MQVDSGSVEAQKFRATASASIDGTAGAWGDGDMLCVRLDSNGELILATATECDGVIWTPEGRKEPASGSAHKDVVGGRKYTVWTFCELTEAETAASPALAAGEKLWAEASGDIDNGGSPGTGSIFVGHVMAGGSRVVINVNGRPASA